jgi:hypothetical protein
MGRIVPEGWAFVAVERKAIQSFRLRLHSRSFDCAQDRAEGFFNGAAEAARLEAVP